MSDNLNNSREAMSKINNERKMKIISIAVVLITLIIGGGIIFFREKMNNKNDNSDKSVEVTSTPKPSPEPTPEPTKAIVAPKESEKPTIPPGKAVSPLTGLYVDEKIAQSRPYAVMYNNLSVASPQSGIGGADILYECVTEGGITRLMGIFGSIKSDRVGSLRSARHYFVSFAKEWDAIYIHCGGSDKAYEYINSLGVDDLDAIKGIGGTLMYRDNSISAPHNAFTSKERVQKSLDIVKYRTNSEAKEGNHFAFCEEEYTDKKGVDAGYVSITFSNYTTPYFVYNKKNGKYLRYQFGKEHTDKNTRKPLYFKNILIMEVDEWTMDKQGRQDMAISNNKGDGWFITNGKATKIKWVKNESKNIMKFVDEKGNILNINKGKTYIAVLPLNRVDELVIKKSEK